jgi:WD40 repeat protein
MFCFLCPGAIKSVAVSADSKCFASGSYDKTVRLWRTRDAELLHELAGIDWQILIILLSARFQSLPYPHPYNNEHVRWPFQVTQRVWRWWCFPLRVIIWPPDLGTGRRYSGIKRSFVDFHVINSAVHRCLTLFNICKLCSILGF